MAEIPLLIFNNLTKVYDAHQPGANNVVALDGISFTVHPGEFCRWWGARARGKPRFSK